MLTQLLFRGDYTVDDLIDTIEGNRKYVRCIYAYNKADIISLEEVDALARQPHSVCISCYMSLGLEYLLERVWDAMGLVRVYTKKVGCKPDFAEPVILSADRGGTTVENFCNHLHRVRIDASLNRRRRF
jgi:ribosome-interacting GTPase 1